MRGERGPKEAVGGKSNEAMQDLGVKMGILAA